MAQLFKNTINELNQLIKLQKTLREDLRLYLSELKKTRPTTSKGVKEQQAAQTNIYKTVKKQQEVEQRSNILKKEILKTKQSELKVEVQKTRYAKELLLKQEIARQKQKQIRDEVRKTAKQMAGVTKNTNTWAIALKSFPAKFNTIGNIIGGVITSGIMMATSQIRNFVNGSIEAFQVQEKAVAAADVVFGAYSKTIQKIASDVQKVTTVGDESFLRLAVQARNFGIAVDDVEDATKGAIGLFQKFEAAGLSQESALKGIALAYEGNFSQLERYIPALRSAGSESEKMAILQREMGEGFRQAEEFAKTETGQIIQQQNEIGDLQEQIGGKLIPVKVQFLKIVKTLVKFLVDYGGAIKNLVVFVGSFLVVQKAITIATRIYNTQVTKSGKGLKALSSGMTKLGGKFKDFLSANWMGLMAIGIFKLGQKMYELITAQSVLEESNDKIREQFAEQTADLKILELRLANTKKGTEAYNNILSELNGKLQESGLATLELDATNEQLSESFRLLRGEILKNIKIEVYTDKIKELTKEELKFNDAIEEGVGSLEGFYRDALAATRWEIEQLTNELIGLEAQTTDTGKEIEKLGDNLSSTGAGSTIFNLKMDSATKAVAAQKEAAKKAAEELKKLRDEMKGVADDTDTMATVGAQSIPVTEEQTEKIGEYRDALQGMSDELIAMGDVDTGGMKWSEILSLIDQEDIDFIHDSLDQVADIFGSFIDARIKKLDELIEAQNNELTEAQTYYETQQQLADDGLANDLTRAKEARDAEKAELKALEAQRKEAGEKQKRLSKAALTVDYIAELGKISLYAASNIEANVFTGGAWAAAVIAIQSLLATGRYAAGLAQINAQKFEDGGRVGGERHSNGGTLIEAEKDEFVVERNAAMSNLDLLEHINSGGSVSDLVQKSMTLNTIEKSNTGDVAWQLAMLGEMKKNNSLTENHRQYYVIDGKLTEVYIHKNIKNNFN